MVTSSGLFTLVSTVRTDAARREAQHDAGLVQRFLGGDETAFLEIMTRYRDRLYGVALGVLRNHTDAEEIAQDAFIRAHRGLAKFRGEASLATWLHRIALNLARNRYWYFFRRGRGKTDSLDSACSETNPSTFSDQIAADEASPMRTAVVDEFSGLVTTCMARLSPPQRDILTLRNSQQRSYEEIAQELGINVGTVKSRIARARENLRVLFTLACPEFGADAQPAAWFEVQRTTGGTVRRCV